MNKIHAEDTIAAISTTLGPAALSIIRLTGKDSLNIISKIFISNKIDINSAQHHRLYHGNIINSISGKIIDDVMVVFMPEGKSFTMELMAEIHCHGGNLVPREVLKSVLYLGARIAQPGEFSKRAYLNGRLDLTQAEAINDIISAKSLFGLESAVSNLDRKFSLLINGFRDSLIKILSHLEVLIDYPEEDLEDISFNSVIDNLKTINDSVGLILEKNRYGKVLKVGVKVSIMGKTNVGKSSLFNYILGEDRAIVSDVHGTTRDFLDSDINFFGLPVEIMDTAGIRETSDTIEIQGRNRAIELIGSVDYVIWVFDKSRSWDFSDDAFLKFFDSNNFDKLIFVVNKDDLDFSFDFPDNLSSLISDFSKRVFYISVLEKKGLFEFTEALKDIFVGSKFNVNENIILCNIRHEKLLLSFRDILFKIIDAMHSDLSYEYISVDFRRALDILAEITGEVTNDEILDNIFSNFCVGK